MVDVLFLRYFGLVTSCCLLGQARSRERDICLSPKSLDLVKIMSRIYLQIVSFSKLKISVQTSAVIVVMCSDHSRIASGNSQTAVMPPDNNNIVHSRIIIPPMTSFAASYFRCDFVSHLAETSEKAVGSLEVVVGSSFSLSSSSPFSPSFLKRILD